MDINRRHLIGASAAGALAMSTDDARAAPLTSALGRDATHYGVRPGSPDDQTQILQRAIDDAARAQVPLADNNARKTPHTRGTSPRKPAAGLPKRL